MSGSEDRPAPLFILWAYEGRTSDDSGGNRRG